VVVAAVAVAVAVADAVLAVAVVVVAVAAVAVATVAIDDNPHVVSAPIFYTLGPCEICSHMALFSIDPNPTPAVEPLSLDILRSDPFP
ncbi:MAG: hypothetical protein LW699_11885, partial [Pirellula sp.]|nr:hypothetical protein [Pirellula sp.]